MYSRFLFTSVFVLLISAMAFGHCDTLAGPVVQDAKMALQRGDVSIALKWVRPQDESEVRKAFARTLAARTAGGDAGDVADTWFFETLVRLHRAGEGAPFTGLKPAEAVEPEIVAADRALESGNGAALAKEIADLTAAELQRRLAVARETRAHAGDSVEAGRRFVAAYVDYVHFVERAADLSGSAEVAREVHQH